MITALKQFADRTVRSWMHQLHDLVGKPFRWFLTRTRPGNWVRTHTTPNFWSLLRVPLSVAVGTILWFQFLGWASLVTGLAILTDRLDGELARLESKESTLGMILDTVADFVFLIAIIVGTTPLFPIWQIPAVVIGLEVIRLTGALVVWTLPRFEGRERGLRPNMSGKFKMTSAVAAILFVLWGLPMVGHWFMVVAITFSAWSMGRHLYDLRKTPRLKVIRSPKARIG